MILENKVDLLFNEYIKIKKSNVFEKVIIKITNSKNQIEISINDSYTDTFDKEEFDKRILSKIYILYLSFNSKYMKNVSLKGDGVNLTLDSYDKLVLENVSVENIELFNIIAKSKENNNITKYDSNIKRYIVSIMSIIYLKLRKNFKDATGYANIFDKQTYKSYLFNKERMPENEENLVLLDICRYAKKLGLDRNSVHEVLGKIRENFPEDKLVNTIAENALIEVSNTPGNLARNTVVLNTALQEINVVRLVEKTAFGAYIFLDRVFNDRV